MGFIIIIIIMPALHNLDAIRGETRRKYKTKLFGKTLKIVIMSLCVLTAREAVSVLFSLYLGWIQIIP